MSLVYLSEMSAAPIHGGGLTLHRILGSGLQRFDWFVKTIQYSSEPVNEWPNRDRCISFRFWTEANWLKKLIGCSAACWLGRKNSLRRLHAYHAATVLVRNGVVSDGARLLVCPQGEFTLYTMHRLRQLARVSYVTWFMDDHLLRWNGDGWRYGHDYETMMREHLQRAEKVFVISPELGRFYRERFGVESEVLFGPCEKLEEPVWKRPESKNSCRLAYFGSVGPWQQDALEALLPLVKTQTVYLDVFANDTALVPQSFKEAGASVLSKVSPGEVAAKMRSYDAVVLPISFHPELRHLSCFNIATKMAECLGSGIPVLVIGPPDSAMIRFLRPHDAAEIVTNPTAAHLREAVGRLLGSERRRCLISNALKLVEEALCVEVMKHRWEPVGKWLGLEGEEPSVSMGVKES